MWKGIGWAAVALGAVAGLLAMAMIALAASGSLWLAGRAGLPVEGGGAWGVLLALVAGEVVAGYVAGRLGRPSVGGLHGSLAALGLYTVVTSMSLIAGSPAGVPTLVVFATLSMAIGYGAGALGVRAAAARDAG